MDTVKKIILLIHLLVQIHFEKLLRYIRIYATRFANYSGGIIITDWYSEDSNPSEAIKISVNF